MMDAVKALLARLSGREAESARRRMEAQNLRIAEDWARVYSEHQALLTLTKEQLMHESSLAVVHQMGHMLELFDKEQYRHAQRVAKVAVRLATRFGMEQSWCALLALAAPLHDIGKLLLNHGDDSGRKDHCRLGGLALSGEDALLAMAARIARSHHEHYDGSGYPDALLGADIPLEARFVALADEFDALVMGEYDRAPMDIDAAMRALVKDYGRRFDPGLLRALDKMQAELELAYENIVPLNRKGGAA